MLFQRVQLNYVVSKGATCVASLNASIARMLVGCAAGLRLILFLDFSGVICGFSFCSHVISIVQVLVLYLGWW
jgi:hypothetical protein